jgi:hypothetical protein
MSAVEPPALRAGRIIAELFDSVVPKTVENFKCLCTGEKGLGKSSKKPLHFKVGFVALMFFFAALLYCSSTQKSLACAANVTCGYCSSPRGRWSMAVMLHALQWSAAEAQLQLVAVTRNVFVSCSCQHKDSKADAHQLPLTTEIMKKGLHWYCAHCCRATSSIGSWRASAVKEGMSYEVGTCCVHSNAKKC